LAIYGCGEFAAAFYIMAADNKLTCRLWPGSLVAHTVPVTNHLDSSSHPTRPTSHPTRPTSHSFTYSLTQPFILLLSMKITKRVATVFANCVSSLSGFAQAVLKAFAFTTIGSR